MALNAEPLQPPAGPAAAEHLHPAAAHQLLAGVRTGVVALDLRGVVYANPMAATMFGRTVAALTGQSVAALIAPAFRDTTLEQLRRRFAGEPGRPQDVRCLHSNGHEFDVRLWGQPLWLDGRRVTLVTLIDISELKDAVRKAEWRASMLAQSELLCRSGSFVVHWPSLKVEVSEGLRTLAGLAPEAPVAEDLDQQVWIPEDERALVAGLWRAATAGQPFEFQHRLATADGRRLVVLHRGVLNEPATPGGPGLGMAIVKDVTANHDAEGRVYELANFDEITGLANRANLLEQLDAAVQAARWDPRGISLLSIEVPRISELASTMGIGAADALAMAMAARLSAGLSADEAVAHLGGSEFALLRRHAAAPERAADLSRAVALQAALTQPVPLGGAEISPACRIGIAAFPTDGDTPHRLLAASQTARLNAATAAASVACFMPDTNARAWRELQLESALRQAMPRGELSLVYQPQVCLRTGTVLGAEALLRWQSAELGFVSPNEFIPVAERVGLIAAIGQWVIHQACEQAVQWQRAGLPVIRVGVNISPVQFQLGDVEAIVKAALQDTGATAAMLGVELTESALRDDGEQVASTLRVLQAMGIEISLDDFGTGFSSLSRLRHLPIDLLKIDRSFISDVTAAPESASVTRSIINLAHGLRIPVLAEGVETEGQLKLLVANGCDRLQGYFFSRPVSAQAMGELLAEGRHLRAHLAPSRTTEHTLLLVDDEAHVLAALKRLFRRDGYRLLTATSGEQALELLAQTPVDVIISDQRMPGMTGVEFLRRAKALHPETLRLCLSGFADLQTIIDAVNEGAIYKFLMKPWDDERLREHVAQAFTQKGLADDNRRLQHQVATAHAEQAALNLRLSQLLEHHREDASLMQASAEGLRTVLDLLPGAVFGLSPDGVPAYMNASAQALLPQAMACLGASPVPELTSLLNTLPSGAAGAAAEHTVKWAGATWRASLRPLPGVPVREGDHRGQVDRGLVLVLNPCPAQQSDLTGDTHHG